jgi:hypothetical protein
VVAVRVTDDDVLDICRFKAEFRQAIDDFRLRRPREIGVDDDQTPTCLQGL